ncbi:class I adenylate-forming enzyme family protein [Oceanobacillus halophilus]|uniref:Acyl-CoA synthetase n=1 Tax=Oceanobacillus halophilus TaxID=930130 RepID=A0A495A7R5_9BACI|nr:AMP-binding protein [Oceanobacillus halophilus]RKQ35769.1 acyl-CoA synthetase [Oceanobacillus halophilus]
MEKTIDLIEQLVNEEHVVVRKLEEQAVKYGDKMFLYYGEDNNRYTYKEFNEMTNCIAHNLVSLGLKKGDRVSVFMKNSFLSTLVMFSVWKAGGVFAPINFNYKGKSLSYLINDTDPLMLIMEDELGNEYKKISNSINNKDIINIVYQSDEKVSNSKQKIMQSKEISFNSLLNGDMTNLDVDLYYFDEASIIYTSGTTGLPKGVVQSHRWIYAYSFFFGKILNHEDIIYNDLPLYHVGGAFFNITRAVFAGCGVALWDKFSSSNFWERIRVSQATSAVLVGVMTTWLMNAEETPEDRNNTLNKVHIQPLPDYHTKLAKRFGFDFILAGFGQTESGFGICGLIDELGEEYGTPKEMYRGYPKEDILEIARNLNLEVVKGNSEIKKGYMGKSSFFLEATVLNENDEQCLPNEIGELSVRPKVPSLILSEYYKKNEETLEAFKNLWFHTGDFAYKDEDGIFHFVDRKGSILKVRGEKVSSYQVEDELYEHPSIEVSVVFPITEEYGDEIAAYIVLKEGSEIEEKEIRDWVEVNLPRYMWPKYIKFVDEIPKTLTNKIQKFKLKEHLIKVLNGSD